MSIIDNSVTRPNTTVLDLYQHSIAEFFFAENLATRKLWMSLKIHLSLNLYKKIINYLFAGCRWLYIESVLEFLLTLSDNLLLSGTHRIVVTRPYCTVPRPLGYYTDEFALSASGPQVDDNFKT